MSSASPSKSAAKAGASFKRISRPPLLYPLFAPAHTIKGVGLKLAESIGKLAGDKVIDILRLAPSSIIARHLRASLTEVTNGDVVTLYITPLQHIDRKPYRVVCTHPKTAAAGATAASLELLFFNINKEYLAQQLPIGKPCFVSGKAEWYNGRLQIIHPDYILPDGRGDEIPEIEAVYPTTAGITSRRIYRIIQNGLAGLPRLTEWIGGDIMARFGWQAWHEAMAALHCPKHPTDLLPGAKPRMRLAYDELLANQLALHLVRQQAGLATSDEVVGGRNHCAHKQTLAKRLIAGLPFALTEAQKRVLREIISDQKSPRRMLRLLMGDVGAGKTVVALVAALNVVESGRQVAIIAPTEMLARQHYATLSQLVAGLGVKVVLLVGTLKAAEKQTAHTAIASGEAAIIIGTHSLIAEATQFHDLGLAIIDEQHRFGVRQRLLLGQKGQDVDVLLMTATPIPRSLAMTAYGDLDASRLDEKPPGRKAITTSVMSHHRLQSLIDRLRLTASPSMRVYWVCPFVAEREGDDIAAVESRFHKLAKVLPELKPVLVHGRLASDARQAAMEKFRNGSSCLLVATTVIEVGVDVPEAQVMIVEDAHRFGLAQLHQLRGRVGRSAGQAACVLLYRHPTNATAHARLNIMRESQDGFHIAEEDLRLRGPGEILGKRQSGEAEFIHADLAQHGDLLALANDQAKAVLAADPWLARQQNIPLRLLLALYDRQQAVAYLAGG